MEPTEDLLIADRFTIIMIMEILSANRILFRKSMMKLIVQSPKG